VTDAEAVEDRVVPGVPPAEVLEDGPTLGRVPLLDQGKGLVAAVVQLGEDLDISTLAIRSLSCRRRS
jgi:hypothetical protein